MGKISSKKATVNYIEIEKKYPVTCKGLQDMFEEEYKLFLKKQYDYGTTNVTVGQDLSTPDGQRVAKSALIFRLNDKVQRLMNLVVKKGVTESANEPIEDAFKDISLIAKIALLVDRDQWGK